MFTYRTLTTQQYVNAVVDVISKVDFARNNPGIHLLNYPAPFRIYSWDQRAPVILGNGD